jgi:hypothetical protein
MKITKTNEQFEIEWSNHYMKSISILKEYQVVYTSGLHYININGHLISFDYRVDDDILEIFSAELFSCGKFRPINIEKCEYYEKIMNLFEKYMMEY